jgi:hypothetical protein
MSIRFMTMGSIFELLTLLIISFLGAIAESMNMTIANADNLDLSIWVTGFGAIAYILRKSVDLVAMLVKGAVLSGVELLSSWPFYFSWRKRSLGFRAGHQAAIAFLSFTILEAVISQSSTRFWQCTKGPCVSPLQ